MSGDTILNNRYRLFAQQGSGGMAVIYRAVDEALGREVAVKILRPSLTSDPSFITRFQNEARSIANLSHPNIVTVYDVGREGNTNYIVMEFVKGEDLKKIIRTHGALPIDRALNISIEICAGLGFAHRSKIVHADVKPQNILITKDDDRVKITDFGIAQALTDTQPIQRASVVWGSPHYFAPEQAQGEKPTAAADVYAIGIVMFEMFTGRLPFTGTNQQELALAHIQQEAPDVREFNPAVPQAIASIIKKTMSKAPRDRYSMADQLGRVLISIREQGGNQTMPRQTAPPPAQGDSRPITPPPPQQNQPGTTPPYPREQALQQGYPLPQRSPYRPNEEALPTQRYNPAPDAPNPQGFGRASVPAPGVQPQQPYAQPQPIPPGGDSRQNSAFVPRQPYEQDAPNSLDGVTIALAFLAFMAVACLIPLYIAVLQARLG